MTILWAARVVIVSAVLVAATSEPAQQPVNPAGAAALEFHKRVEAYMSIHKAAEGKVPNLGNTDDPAKISGREAALGQAIQALRAGAKAGDVFAPEEQPFLIKIVRD